MIEMAERPSTSGSASQSAIRLVVSGDGTFAALVEPERIVLVRLPELKVDSEIGIEGDADSNEVVFTGPPTRLVLLSRIRTRACLYVIDPAGPKKISELEFVTSMRIAAASGNSVLVACGTATVIIDASKAELLVSQVGSRLAISAAGSFGVDRFIVCMGGILEELDAHTGAPARRFRFSQPVVARHVGGDHRRIWWVSRAHPKRLEIFALTGNRQPRHIDLPEPAERIAADASGERLVVVGGHTGFVIGLGPNLGRDASVTSLAQGRIEDAAWQGGGSALVLAAVGRPLDAVPWPPHSGSAAPAAGLSSMQRDGDGEAGPAAPPSLVPPILPPLGGSDAHAAPAPVEFSASRVMTIPERLALWRQRARRPSPSATTAERPVATARAAAVTRPRARDGASAATGWREAVADWSRGVLSGNAGSPPVHGDDPIQAVATRLELDSELRGGLYLAYGARLCGHDSIVPSDLAGVIGGRWDEALGGGRLAASGALVWRRSRIRLAAVVTAALDELPARTGTVVAGDAGAATTVAVVAPAMVDLDRISTWAAAIVGALLVPGAAAEQRPHAFLLEARVRGVRPLVRWPLPEAMPSSAVLVVDDEHELAGLDIPVVGRWQDAGS